MLIRQEIGIRDGSSVGALQHSMYSQKDQMQ